MIQRPLAACCGPLLLAACAGAIVTPVDGVPETSGFTDLSAVRAAETPGTSQFVEAIRDYGKPRDVPAAFQHLVEWHVGNGPVVLLFTAGGRRACALSQTEAWRVLLRRPYTCRWSAAR